LQRLQTMFRFRTLPLLASNIGSDATLVTRRVAVVRLTESFHQHKLPPAEIARLPAGRTPMSCRIFLNRESFQRDRPVIWRYARALIIKLESEPNIDPRAVSESGMSCGAYDVWDGGVRSRESASASKHSIALTQKGFARRIRKLCIFPAPAVLLHACLPRTQRP
jgi:hypothetical protein